MYRGEGGRNADSGPAFFIVKVYNLSIFYYRFGRECCMILKNRKFMQTYL